MSSEIKKIISEYNSPLDFSQPYISIILAGGHGKRIKSEVPKLLHKIWGIPSVIRVSQAAKKGLKTDNQIIVVGVKAEEVIPKIGKKKGRCFVYQAKQLGTGDAVRCAISQIPNDYKGSVFIFPGDMGLLTPKEIKCMKNSFEEKKPDLMILSAFFQGPIKQNYYGRILRFRPQENDSPIAAIREHRDILALSPNDCLEFSSDTEKVVFKRDALLKEKEYNTGVFAISSKPLLKLIGNLTHNNAQGEIYLTDLVESFRQQNLLISALPIQDPDVALGFNNKSVLKVMEDLARERIYELLKNVIEIADKSDFFIAEEVVEQILDLDKAGINSEIKIGVGAHIEKGVKIQPGLIVGDHSRIIGNIHFEKDVHIDENVCLETYPQQTMTIGERCKFRTGCIVRGNTTLGNDTAIETGVRITGSDEWPVRIGDRVRIKGTSYLLGSIVESDVLIEHSVLKYKKIVGRKNEQGENRAIRFFLPHPEGVDAIHELIHE